MSLLDIAWEVTKVVYLLAASTVGLCIWGAIIWGLLAAFKNYRLYSRHWFAVRIRRYLDARKAAARQAAFVRDR